MKKILSVLFFTCVYANAYTQVNFVKNPSFEKFDTCPYLAGQVFLANNWQNAIVPKFNRGVEYFNSCSPSIAYVSCPETYISYQYPRTGNGMVGLQLYYDKTFPPPPPPYPFHNREYLQSLLNGSLLKGKVYCVSFWVNLAEGCGYAHNKIGAYLDDGTINTLADSAGEEITSVTPQVYTDSVIKDTLNWIKIEGTFVAQGTESFISIGNFFPNAITTKISTFYWLTNEQYSYYLLDDVSVIPIDLAADAGKDTWVEMGKKVQIGRVGDTTAQGLDCKWYKKGVLIDSGAIITVNANAIKNAVDTYVVVQTICGLVKTDTVTVKTAGLGVSEYGYGNTFSVYPNPSNGAITITSSIPPQRAITAMLYDLLGRVVHQEPLNFSNKEAVLKLNIPGGSYILELKDEAGNVQRERIVIN